MGFAHNHVQKRADSLGKEWYRLVQYYRVSVLTNNFYTRNVESANIPERFFCELAKRRKG